MSENEFQALVLREEGGKINAAIESLADDALPAGDEAGDVTIAVEYSSLNYKDAMVVRGLGKLVRTYPHVPGIDFAGEVIDSSHADYKAGDPVILTGWGVGERQWGGYATRARVRGDWLVPLPKGMTTQSAMAIGTAGLAAMRSIMALEAHGLSPRQGPVLVTGATGGVGSIAILLLSELGYEVAASTGKSSQHDGLHKLGAHTIVARSELDKPSTELLEPRRWAGCIDNVGGVTLASVLNQLKERGALAAVGMAGGSRSDISLLPLLLRGVNMLGIDTSMTPMPQRLEAWDRLAKLLPADRLESITRIEPLANVPALSDEILAGRITGRVVIALKK